MSYKLIANNVDVTNCEFGEKGGYKCYLYDGDDCREAPNCYFKQMQREKNKANELQQKLIKVNNELIGKDTKIASMQNACDPQIVEDACTFVLSFFLFIKSEKTTIFKLDEETLAELEKIGKALNDYQEGKPNPFADEYFSGLTYTEIAELAKKSIRLTTEHCEDLHKIETLETALFEIALIINELKQQYDDMADYSEIKEILSIIQKIRGGKNE